MRLKPKKTSGYTIGYRKPPKHTQFKPGTSGNPKGRPKGTKNLSTDLAEEFAMRISVKENGRQIKISKQRALVKSLLGRALQGDIRSANTVLNMFLRLLPPEELGADDYEFTQTDDQVLEEFLASATVKKQKRGKGND